MRYAHYRENHNQLIMEEEEGAMHPNALQVVRHAPAQSLIDWNKIAFYVKQASRTPLCAWFFLQDLFGEEAALAVKRLKIDLFCGAGFF